KGVFQFDLQLNNFLVTFFENTYQVSSIDLVDWGMATQVKMPVTEQEVFAYCVRETLL
ncbi:hypothetical protein GYMLUDRAFT_551202, partial [Collybiopsis luxurians FD-317 M1]